ncbi:MAG: signal peptidase I [Corallococcus sp.]|nr:signal peptidase I [Corallococcus sp.]MCM1395794.1 signal peptidase I [Corallococcus sp.]
MSEQNNDLQLNIKETASPVEADNDANYVPYVAGRTKVKAARWRKADKFFDVLLWVSVFILAALVLTRTFVATNIGVSGSSMYDTFEDGEIVWVNKLAKPERGQVVVFFKYDVDSKFWSLFGTAQDNDRGGKYEKLIKRVVATEGDSVWVEHRGNGEYDFVVQSPSGEIIYEDYYVKGDRKLDAFTVKDRNVLSGLGLLRNHIGQENALRIRDGYFFAMGDNRGDSTDSRVLDVIPYDRIFGVLID